MPNVLTAAVVLAACCGCSVATAQTVEFRIIEREGQTTIASASDAQLNMAVQARVVGGAPGTALSSFSFDVVILGEPDTFGTLERALISNADGTYASAIAVSEVVGRGGLARQFTYFAGVSPRFNGNINVSAGSFTNTPQQEIGLVFGFSAGAALLGTPGLDANQDGVPDTYPGSGTTAPLDPAIGAQYFAVGGGWIDVYSFRYTATNLSTRTLRFEVQPTGAQTFTTLQVSTGLWGEADNAVTATSATPTLITIAVSDAGVCCDGSGACTASTGAACANAFIVGVSCSPTACTPSGSCCTQTGQCGIAPQTDCVGQWTQEGSCTPNVCPQPGACCATDGSCTLLIQPSCNALSWIPGSVCSPNSCPPAGACCGSGCQFIIQQACDSDRTWTLGVCTPDPCPQIACCNVVTGACALSDAPADVFYSLSYQNGTPNYARSNLGGTVESISTTFDPGTHRLVFDALFSGATSGGPLITSGFWLVLDDGPNPKAHSGELAIFYFDGTTLGSPTLAVYAYNGADASTSWSDGDPVTPGDQPGDLIKGIYETSYINSIVAEDTTVSGQFRRHLKFDIDAGDIISHVPAYPASSPWYGAGFASSLGLWFHSVGSFAATYESNTGGHRGAITALAISDEGWLDGADITAGGNDPCPSGSRATPGAACTPDNTCAQPRACCDAANSLCLVVGPRDDCPTNFTFASPQASACSPNPCGGGSLQAGGACCNTLTGGCWVLPLAGCGLSTSTWHAGGVCAPNLCPPSQGACCNVVAGTCAVSSQSGCAPAAHDWRAGGTCTPNICAAPGICCNIATATCRRLTQARCSSGCTWAPAGVCSPDPCSLPGPCCNVVTGTCQLTLQLACPSGGHDWMPGSACSPNPCAVPGVCCNAATGACRRLTQARCLADNTWSSEGACSPNPCTLPGPCCNVVTGACQLVLQTACLSGGHDWTPGTTCSPSPCTSPGVCCNMATGACRRLTQTRCTTGCVWIASGSCSPSPCSMPQGACCNVVVGTCAVSAESDCAPAAHDWFAGGSCSPNACPAPAACCDMDSGVCRRLTQVRCMTANGTWFTGETCAPSPCFAPLVAPCTADFDRSGHADMQDVLAFLNAWFASDPRADINSSGETDVSDVFDFLSVWFVGC